MAFDGKTFYAVHSTFPVPVLRTYLFAVFRACLPTPTIRTYARGEMALSGSPWSAHNLTSSAMATST